MSAESARFYIQLLATGLGYTLWLSTMSVALAVFIGVIFGALRSAKVRVASKIVAAYVDLFRAVPILIIIFLVYYGIPALTGWSIGIMPAATISIALYYGGYFTEVVRTGIEGVPVGQWEASESLGLGYLKTMRWVVARQALRIALPAGTSNCIAAIKDTSLASTIGVLELTESAMIIRQQVHSTWAVFSVLSALYLAINLGVSLLGNWAERRLDIDRPPVSRARAGSRRTDGHLGGLG